MSNAEDIVVAVFKAVDTTDAAAGRAAFADAITDDCVWANSGFPTANGKEACLATWDAFNAGFGFTGFRVELIALAATEDKVVTERIDHLLNADGEVFNSLPLAGTIELRDGKICAWRDYFDPRPFLG